MEFSTKLLDLPNEILIKIFEKNSFTSLKNLTLVCKRFLNIVDELNFFSKAVLTINERNQNYVVKPSNIHHLMERKLLTTVEIDQTRYNIEKKIFPKYGKYIKKLILKTARPLICSLEYLHNLESLHLEEMWTAYRYCPDDINLCESRKLRSIIVSRCNSFDWLSRISSPLEEITISSGYFDANVLLNVLEKHCNSLKNVNLKLFKFDGNLRDFDEIFAKMPKLIDLKLNGCFVVTDIFKNSNRNFINLQKLELYFKIGITCNDIKNIAEACPKLKCLKLYCFQQEDSFPLNNFNHLTSLQIGLRSESLFDHIKLIDSFLSIDRSRLEELSLINVQLNEECVLKLAQKLHNLCILELIECKDGVTDTSLQKIFQHMTKLKVLNLCGCSKITDEGILGIPSGFSILRLIGLQELNLSGCHQITDRSIIQFKFPELKKFDFYDMRISSLILVALVNNCSIEEIEIKRWEKYKFYITQHGYEYLSRFY